MNKIVGISFLDDSQIEYFYTTLEELKKDTTVIVEINGVKKFGKVVTPIHSIDTKNLKKELGKIIRVANKKDYYQNKDNIKLSKEALKNCKKLIKKYNLEMNVIDAFYSFDRDQLMFTFYAEQRIDFRDLAKELASIYSSAKL